MPIIKTLLKATKLEKEKFKIPKSVQDAIPIQRIWPDGIFQVGSRFSKTFFFTDINYSIASKEDKTAMFIDYSELLNALDSGASAKITINNRRIDKAEFEKSLLLPMKEDGLDHYRKEYNEMLLSKVTGTNNSVVQDRYITITVAKKTIDEARTYFARVGTDLITHLSQLSSIGRELDAAARLQIFRDFFKGGEPAAFAFDLKEHMKKGHSFKDWLCPDSMEFQKDHFRLNDRWGRVLYLQGYASYIKDSMIAELCDIPRPGSSPMTSGSWANSLCPSGCWLPSTPSSTVSFRTGRRARPHGYLPTSFTCCSVMSTAPTFSTSCGSASANTTGW